MFKADKVLFVIRQSNQGKPPQASTLLSDLLTCDTRQNKSDKQKTGSSVSHLLMDFMDHLDSVLVAYAFFVQIRLLKKEKLLSSCAASCAATVQQKFCRIRYKGPEDGNI